LLKPGEKALVRLHKLAFLSPERLLGGIANGVGVFSVAWTSFFQHGYLRYYVMTIVLVLTAGMGYRMFNNYTFQANFTPLLELTIYEVSIVGILLVSIGFAVFSSSRLAAVAGLGVVGYAICLLFVFYSAPDLAMTQFTVDTLTVILFVLVLYRLPKYMQISNKLTIARDGLVSITFGAMVTLLALLVLDQPVQRDVADYYAANAYLLAKGKNVVNVILVDFRGLDTLVEITVLSIAALGVFGLLKLRLKTTERRG
jgi:multicomponent Na+:H+ antiporter subunit A